MPQPYDYSIQAQNPFQAVLQGYQGGMAIRNDMQAQQQQEAARQAQLQQAEVIRRLISNPRAGAQDYADAMLQVPQLKDQLKAAWEAKDKDQQQAGLADLSQWGAAIQSGQPKVASDAIRARAEAIEKAAGAPTQESKALRTQADMIDIHPEFAGTMMKALLAAHPEGGKVITNLATLGQEQRAAELQPALVAKGNAAAIQEQAKAGTAGEVAQLDAQKKAEDIKTERQKRDLAAIEIQIKQATSDTDRQRLELEREKLSAEIAAKQEAKAATATAAATGAQDQLDTLTQALGTVQAIKKHPGLAGFFGGTGALNFGGVGTVGGNVIAMIPGTDAKDIRAMVETLKSQQFLAAASQMKGMGALSDAEGARLERAVASLDTDQSDAQFKTTLGVIESTLNKAQAKIIAAGKAPTSGGAVIMTHPVYGKIADGDINRLMAQYPGATRDQVLQYLRSTGGK